MFGFWLFVRQLQLLLDTIGGAAVGSDATRRDVGCNTKLFEGDRW